MGNIFSVSISGDQFVRGLSCFLCGKANYVRELGENLETLETAVKELEAKRDDMLRRVEIEEGKGLQRLAEVHVWLSRVAAIEPHVSNLLDVRIAEAQRWCFCGYCSKNIISTYCYSKEILKKLKEVEGLISAGSFETVAEIAPPPKVMERPIQPTVGLETMLEKAWKHLLEDGVTSLGLYGMGGVGKTTLLCQINNKFLEARSEFDIVIWVVVSKDLQTERIQEETGKRLGLDNEEWKQKTLNEKASDIYKALRRKRFVLLLDDIWSKVTLVEIGIPLPSMTNRCKVAFTTRSKEVCGRMGVDIEMEVKCLESHDAWALFQAKVGEITLKSHPDIPKLAKIVVEKCRGLPLALNVIGETMACKRTVREWCHAIDVLVSSATEFSGMEDEILPILKFSYDDIKSEKAKLCLQYCALYPEDCDIPKFQLVEYWIGEGIVDEKEDIERVENQAYEIISTLVRACLLMEDKLGRCVKLHDVVREMALWIASDFGKQKNLLLVKAGTGLRQMPRVEDWKAVRRISLMNNHIDNITDNPECPELVTLLLRNNSLVKISGEFFQFMPTLVVLDLSGNSLINLPEEISSLVSLQYLNLRLTKIEQLPIGLKALVKLQYLNLERTYRLQSITGISSLSNLRVLKLYASGLPSNIGLIKELEPLQHLKLLSITLRKAYVLDRLLSNRTLASCTQCLFLREFVASLGISFVPTLDRLRDLSIVESDIPEIKLDWKGNESEAVSSLGCVRASPSSTCFQNLSCVEIVLCQGLRDLTWLLYAPNLASLYVAFSLQIKEIISKEKAESFAGEQTSIIPFLRLERLYLEDLDNMSSIYWGPLPFPCLRLLGVKQCPKLRKLPFNSESSMGNHLDVVAKEEWLEGVEWEDIATKERFILSRKAYL